MDIGSQQSTSTSTRTTRRTTDYWKNYLDWEDIPIQHTHVWITNYISTINIMGCQTIGYDIGRSTIASIAHAGILTWRVGSFDGQ